MRRIAALFYAYWLRLAATPGPAGLLLLIVGTEAISIDDRGAALFGSNVAIKRHGMAECEPTLGGKAMFDDRPPPEDPDVDARVASAGRAARNWQRMSGS
jgi:Asp-tRNA(Asn)/Glu-tRNA(Gln) amidotransferase A subunit family amidase